MNLTNILSQLHSTLFQCIISNKLIYNTCWEDPRIDRELLEINGESRIVTITGAGCNTLDYLLDNPGHIFCVDQNPIQNALLELKLALFQNNSHSLLWDMFGEGKKRGAEFLYKNKLRKLISKQATKYWDRQISTVFTPTSNEPSFYYRGTAGKFALLIRKRIKQKGLYLPVMKLLDAQNLEEQTFYFNEIEPLFWDTFQKWIVRQNATLAMLGVPVSQRRMIERQHRGGLLQYIQRVLRKIFTGRPIRDNYFWRVYLTGSYTRECCPNYLKKEYFDLLRTRNHRVTTHNNSLTEFLRKNPDTYSHFVLLDHQDWLLYKDPQLLREEWQLLFKNARPGTRILFRSVSPDHSFLPVFARKKLEFQRELTHSLHQHDRVGTYGSTHLAKVK